MYQNKNKEKFSADNLTVYEGDAAETVAKLPEPDKVFIGGSGKEMSQILETIAAFPKKIKVVISAVTIETIAETNELLGKTSMSFRRQSDGEEKSVAIISWIRIIQ